jgi:hypothetical protein
MEIVKGGAICSKCGSAMVFDGLMSWSCPKCAAPTPADMDESIVPNPTWESDDALGVPREWRESHPAPATTATPEEKK